MARYKKIIDRWKRGSQEEQREQVVAVCNHYFQRATDGGKGAQGSHNIKIEDSRLANFPGSFPRGEMTIPVTNGQRVKKFYLKRIIEAVEHISAQKEFEETTDENTGTPEEASGASPEEVQDCS